MHKHAVLGIVLATLTGCGGAGDETTLISQQGAQVGTSMSPVVPPDQPYQHRTYGEWSAAWWQWAMSLPWTNHPLRAQGATDCSVGQTGTTWFLGGIFSGDSPAIADRTCTIPRGTALFFPVLNGECDTLWGDGRTESELRNCPSNDESGVDNLAVDVDGHPVQVTSNFRVLSPLFIYSVPDDDVPAAFGLTPDPPAGALAIAAADGYFVLLRPLDAGPHVVHFHGEDSNDPQPQGGFFTLDVTYHITVGR